MKLLKTPKINSKFMVILIICLFALLFLPIFLDIIGMRELGIKEKMTDFVHFTDYNKIDRIKVTDATSGSPATYAYCVGGTPTCELDTDTLHQLTDTSYTQGNTYKPLCDRGSASSSSSASGSSTGSEVRCVGNDRWTELQANRFSDYKINNIAFPLSATTNKWFTQPYSYVPIKFDPSNNFMFNLYDSAGSKIVTDSKISKCDLLDNGYQYNCEAEYSTLVGNGTIIDSEYSGALPSGSSGSSSSSSSSGSSSSSSSSTPSGTSNNALNGTDIGSSSIKSSSSDKCSETSIKCVADFGTNIGDKLCCGQTGVLQNTKYICPSVKPTCSNFKCGSAFGICS